MASERAETVATRHMAVAGHQLAASAAFSVLEAGGNAIDAGVAGGLALGILESDLVSVAGVAPIMVYSAETQQVVTISGLGWWPKAADIEHFRREYGGAIPNGVLRTVVPAAPDAWITALELWGRMSFGEVASAAIRYARDGFPMYPLMERIISEHEAEFRAAPDTAAIFLPGGRPPRTGELFFQKEGAAALQYMADEEAAAARRGGRKAGLAAARDAFYKGDIARRIAEWQAAEGGWMTSEDLASFRVGIEEPVRGRFGNADVYACGPWCQGPALIEVLNILGGYDLRELGHNSADAVHVSVEAVKLAMADRDAWLGDPRFVDVPIDTLASEAYAALRRVEIDMGRAMPEMPPPGDAGSRSAGSPQRRCRRGSPKLHRWTPPMSASWTRRAMCSPPRRPTVPMAARWRRASASRSLRAAASPGPTRRMPPRSRPASARVSRPTRRSPCWTEERASCPSARPAATSRRRRCRSA